MSHNQETVSIVVPCRDEERFVDAFVENVLAQDYPNILELIIAEGLSSDGTRQELEKWSNEDSRIVIVDNEDGIVPTGLNRAIEKSTGQIVVRMDVHTYYSADYVQQCVGVLKATKAECAGGPWIARGSNFLQSAIAVAFQSGFSSGGAKSHNVNYEGPVDSVYLGCWWRDTLVSLGMFDEEFVRNQDDELNLRITRSGGVVWQSPRIRSHYNPRKSLGAVLRQYFQYGYWKVRVMQKHKVPAAARHVVPGTTIFLGGVLLGMAPFYGWAAITLVTAALGYCTASLFESLRLARYYAEPRFILVLPPIFACFHFGYALGLIKGVLDFIVLGRGADSRMARITR